MPSSRPPRSAARRRTRAASRPAPPPSASRRNRSRSPAIAAVLVVPQVRARVEELRRQVAVRGDDLAAVESRGLQARGRCPVPRDDLAISGTGDRARHDVEALGRHRRRRQATASVPSCVSMISRPPWNSWPKTTAPLAWATSARRGTPGCTVVVRRELVRRVAGGRVDARDLDDDEPDAARARASWYATSRSDTRPCSAMTVSCRPTTRCGCGGSRRTDSQRREQQRKRRAATLRRHRHARRMARPTPRRGPDRARRDPGGSPSPTCAEDCWNVLATSDALYE